MVLGLSLLAGTPAAGAPSTPPAGSSGWTPALFSYDRPDKLVVEESTPTAAQVDWRGRPPQMKANEPDPAQKGSAAPRAVADLNILRLKFKDADGDVVPVLLCTPRDKKGPFPVVVAVHGLTSNKMQVVAQVAPSLAKRGFAVLAPDMPCHGERPGDPFSVLNRDNPIRSFM